MLKVLFLDVDGVLNGHEWLDDAQSTEIRRDCVLRLNRVLRETGAKVVLSSAWRYMVLDGAMTVRGFECLLRTHGVVGLDIIGITPADEDVAGRGAQVAAWLECNAGVGRYAVVDDDEFDIIERGHPFVRTSGTQGLTDADADRLVALLVPGGARPDRYRCPRCARVGYWTDGTEADYWCQVCGEETPVALMSVESEER